MKDEIRRNIEKKARIIDCISIERLGHPKISLKRATLAIKSIFISIDIKFLKMMLGEKRNGR